MKTLIKIEETLIGALLISSMLICGGCSSIQPSAHTGSRVHLMVVLNHEEVNNGMIQEEPTYSVNVNGIWSSMRKLPYRKQEGIYNRVPVINEALIVAALQQSDVPDNQEVMLSIYDGNQTSAPVLMGVYDGDTIVKSEETIAAEF